MKPCRSDQARLDFQAGQLPTGAKPALDALVESYSIARDSWLGQPIDPSLIKPETAI